MNLTRLALGNPVAVVVGALLVLLFGTLSLSRLPVQMTPDVEYPQIAIVTNWRAAAPEEVESKIIEQQEDVLRIRTVKYSATLLDLMQAYARIRTRDEFRPFVMDRDHVFTMEQALERMRPLIGFAGDWVDLTSYLPEGWEGDPGKRRSATAATFAASLELVKEGRMEIRQSETFAPIQLRRRREERDGSA